MNKQNLEEFFETMFLATFEAGEIAKKKQKGIINIGKKFEDLPNDTELAIATKKAKTVVDEEVQEILLKAASSVLDVTEVKIDAEEDTPTKSLFKGNSLTLVIDPIDGTRKYIDQQDDYSICVALLEKGKILTTIVYFPAKNKFYYIGINGKSYLKTGYSQPEEIILKTKRENIVYRNHRVPDIVDKYLEKIGYKVFRSEANWADGFLDYFAGKYKVIILSTPQIRDVLLGAIIANSPNGFVVDWNGKNLIWPAGKRIEKVIFGVGKVPEDIIDGLKELD